MKQALPGESPLLAESSQNRRRLRRWSVLAGLTLLLAAGSVWCALQRQRAAEQGEAVRKVRRLGGWVFYDCRFAADGSPTGSQPAGPGWVRHALGIDFLGTVDGVILAAGREIEGLPAFGFLPDHGIPVTDEGLAAVRPLSKLTWLALSGTQITDAGLENLADFKDLRWLCLSDTAISDQGLRHLANMTKLERLWLDRTSITGAGAKHLSGLTNLRLLSLRGTRVDDAGLASFRDLNRLESLRLDGTDCSFRAMLRLLREIQGRELLDALQTGGYVRCWEDGEVVSLDLSALRLADDDLAILDQFDRLQWLYLNGTQVTDAGLRWLAHLEQLALLHLADTAVTDAGLKSLEPLRNLETLHLTGTQISHEGVERFRQAMPRRLRIYLDPQPPAMEASRQE